MAYSSMVSCFLNILIFPSFWGCSSNLSSLDSSSFDLMIISIASWIWYFDSFPYYFKMSSLALSNCAKNILGSLTILAFILKLILNSFSISSLIIFFFYCTSSSRTIIDGLASATLSRSMPGSSCILICHSYSVSFPPPRAEWKFLSSASVAFLFRDS